MSKRQFQALFWLLGRDVNCPFIHLLPESSVAQSGNSLVFLYPKHGLSLTRGWEIWCFYCSGAASSVLWSVSIGLIGSRALISSTEFYFLCEAEGGHNARGYIYWVPTMCLPCMMSFTCIIIHHLHPHHHLRGRCYYDPQIQITNMRIREIK